jgi:PadR family transcriptional regulator PadR
MNAQNTISQMRKGIIEFCVMQIIAKGEIYSSELLEKLKESNLIVAEGTLYPLLSRLRKADLVTYRWEESQYGPPRKYYEITDLGKSFLNELNTSWDEIKASIDFIMKGK